MGQGLRVSQHEVELRHWAYKEIAWVAVPALPAASSSAFAMV